MRRRCVKRGLIAIAMTLMALGNRKGLCSETFTLLAAPALAAACKQDRICSWTFEPGARLVTRCRKPLNPLRACIHIAYKSCEYQACGHVECQTMAFTCSFPHKERCERTFCTTWSTPCLTRRIGHESTIWDS